MQNLTIDPAHSANADLLRKMEECILDVDIWLRTPHEFLGGREPIDLLNSNEIEDRQQLENLIDAIKYGHFS